MNLHLHIDRLSIRMPGVKSSQRQLVRAAVEHELARLLASGELDFSAHRNAGAEFPRLTSRLSLGHDNGPAALGVGIAKAVYGQVLAAVGPKSRPSAANRKGAGR
jgi:hypothetical protein